MNGVWTGAVIAAGGTIVGSFISAFVQYVMSRNQQKEQRRTAEIMRQNSLADELRDRILEVISPATWFYLAKWKSRPSPQVNGVSWDPESENYTIKLTDSISRVRLMLNPKDETHAKLIRASESVRSAAFTNDTKDAARFENAIHDLIESGRVVVSQVSAQTTPRL